MKTSIENNFTYHAPQPGQPEKYEKLRAKAKELAYLVVELCPNSRERSVAMTELESAVMWANAAIARNPDSEPIKAKNAGSEISARGVASEFGSLAAAPSEIMWMPAGQHTITALKG